MKKRIFLEMPRDRHISIARSRTFALAFIECSDRSWYAQLHMYLITRFNRGQDMYPTSVTQAYNMITNYLDLNITESHATLSKQESDSESEDDVVFVQKGAENITCFDCGEKGHYRGSSECKKPKNKDGAQLSLTDDVGVESDSESDTMS